MPKTGLHEGAALRAQFIAPWVAIVYPQGAMIQINKFIRTSAVAD